jgi:hypothetical protein
MAERPRRLAELDQVLAGSLRGQDRPSRTRLRWTLAPDSEARVRELVARESVCCPFFTFTVTPGTDALVVDVEVPETQVDGLDALEALAVAAAS